MGDYLILLKHLRVCSVLLCPIFRTNWDFTVNTVPLLVAFATSPSVSVYRCVTNVKPWQLVLVTGNGKPKHRLGRELSGIESWILQTTGVMCLSTSSIPGSGDMFLRQYVSMALSDRNVDSCPCSSPFSCLISFGGHNCRIGYSIMFSCQTFLHFYTSITM